MIVSDITSPPSALHLGTPAVSPTLAPQVLLPSTVHSKDDHNRAVTASLTDFLDLGNNAASPSTAISYYDRSGRPHPHISKPSATANSQQPFLTSGISVERGELPLCSQTSSASYSRMKLVSHSCALSTCPPQSLEMAHQGVNKQSYTKLCKQTRQFISCKHPAITSKVFRDPVHVAG